LRALPISLALAALATGAQAQPAVWDVGPEGSHRRCRIVLSPDPGPVGLSLRFPATCRRALPILGEAGGWAAEGRGFRILDRGGGTLLAFAPRDGGGLAASRRDEAYRAERAIPPADSREPSPTRPPPPPKGVPQAAAIDPAKAPPPDALPGLYALDRAAEREVCRLVLDPQPAERRAVRVMEGCRDPGIAVFDPVAWRYERGRLTLTARKGHEVTLVSHRAGAWRRDPPVGATLVLRRLEP